MAPSRPQPSLQSRPQSQSQSQSKRKTDPKADPSAESKKQERVKDAHVSRHNKRVHLRHDYPRRLNASKAYPWQSPQGAEIVVSGYDDGLYVVWRGGRPLTKDSRTAKVNGKSVPWNHPISIKELDTESGKPCITCPTYHKDRAAFEDEEEELEEDEASLPIIQEVKISTTSPVLHLAVPTLPPAYVPSSSGLDANIPALLQLNIVVVATCADSSVRVITLPLTPPSAEAKYRRTLGAQVCQVLPEAPGLRVPRAVALSWTSTFGEEGGAYVDQGRPSVQSQRLDLLVAVSMSTVGETLNFYRVPTAFDQDTGSSIAEKASHFHSVQLAALAHHISFSPSAYPSPKHSQLMLADNKGSLKVYDPLASDALRSRPSSRDSTQPISTPHGAWIISFNTPFYVSKETPSTYPGLAQRKRIFDARWVLDASSVLVLLSDGEWGVWNVDGAGPKSLTHSHPTTLTDFAIRGFIGDASNPDASATPDMKGRSNQRLAPMTPNTRKVRQESLFSGPVTTATSTANALKGGVSVAAGTTSHGAPDDSVVLWYGGEAYHIPSLASLWQRSVSSSGRDVGSLYGPGLARIEGLDLSGEVLNDMEQLPLRRTPASIGSIAQRDILITGEYRIIIVSTPRPKTPARTLFTQDTGSPSAPFELQLLEKGELDLGGMDRLLDGMAGVERSTGFGKPKRVGFVR